MKSGKHKKKIIQFAKTIRHVLTVLLLSSVLMSCGGGNGSAPAGTTVISGIVSDEVIAGATVTATSVDSGVVLGAATTGTNGSYSINALTTAIGSGYALISSGGTMNGMPYSGNLLAFYSAAANTQQSNLTLITSALAEAANSTNQYTGTALQKQEAILANAISRGLISLDYYSLSGPLIAALQNQVQLTGGQQTVWELAQILASTPKPGGCGLLDDQCTKDVNPGDSLSMTFKGTIVRAPAGVLSSCRVIVDKVSEHGMRMHLETIISPSGLPASNDCQIKGDVTLTLPTSTTLVPDECPKNIATSITTCITTVSEITPSYFFESNDGDPHGATAMNTHSVTPEIGWPGVKFSRSFGAALSVSTALKAGPGQIVQWPGKNAVIFVHGYQPFDGFGGDYDTWRLSVGMRSLGSPITFTWHRFPA